MFEPLEQLLNHLESYVDIDHQQRIHQHHRKALRYEPVDRLPVVFHYPMPADSQFQPMPYREGFDDPEKMLYNELVPKAIDIYQTYRAILNDYPNLKKVIAIVLPDMQGPFDTAELLVGGSIFVDFYERPDDLNSLLAALAQAQVGLARHLQPFITDDGDGFCHQHAIMQRGHILIRNDSAIMLSPEMYREQLAKQL